MLLLLASIFFVLGLGGILGLGIEKYGPLDPNQQRVIKLITGTLVLQGIGLVLIHYFLRLHGVGWREFLGLEPGRVWRGLLWACAVSVVVIPATWLVSRGSEWFITQFQPVEPQPIVVLLREGVGPSQRVFFGIAAIVIAPLFEEAFFRGILYPVIKQSGYPTLALAGTSLLFGAIHATMVTFVPLTFLAMVLAVMYEKTDTLVTPIFIHVFFNLVNFALLVNQAGEQIVT